MTELDRRSLLRAMGGAAAATAFPETIQRALALPANSATGTINDVKHIVVLMQENRSFDHYFGTMRGVRGFSDPRAVTLSTGRSVFYQPTTGTPNYVLPFHPTAPYMGYQFLGDLAHSWSDAHAAWNNGSNDGWIAAKGKETMAYLTRADIPYHYALADAFTICDHYHCSTMTSTDPNRYYLWTGCVGQNGTIPDTLANPWSATTPGTITLNASGGSAGNGTPPYGPVVNNDEQGYGWLTYPERLGAAGISWKIYQDVGTGLNAAGSWGWTGNHFIGNYGDNSLLYFKQYQNAAPGSALYQAALTGTNIYNGGAYNGGSDGTPFAFFSQLKADVMNNALPQVSWVVAPEAYCEHPAYPPNWGAWYVNSVLAALTSNPAVWASTVLIVNFDENDGFFDHIVAPTAPQTSANGLSTVSNVNEIYPGAGTNNSYKAFPYGLGARVPMIIVSPWSKGGWVCSQTFDHTSVIQFIEQRFGVAEPHITPWRRAVCGDLTAAFDFTTSNATNARLPSTTSYLAYPTSSASNATLVGVTAANVVNGTHAPESSYSAAPPASQTMPVQETGLRLARALPYQLDAVGQADLGAASVAITFAVEGTAGAFFHVRTAPGIGAHNSGGGAGPWGYTVEANKTLADTWTPTGSAYDLSVYSNNGFFRRFAGGLTTSSANIDVAVAYNEDGSLTLTLTNNGASSQLVTIVDQYSGSSAQPSIDAGESIAVDWALQGSYSWYDLKVTTSGDASFLRQLAGHVETGGDSVSDPHL